MPPLLILSDFTIDPLVIKLRGRAGDRLTVEAVPPGPVESALVALGRARGDGARAVLVWTLPERACPGFGRRLRGESCSDRDVLAEVDAFCDALVGAADAFGTMLVASWVQPSYRRGLGLLDMRPELGLKALLIRMNARLIERLAERRNIYLLDAERWVQQAARDFNPRLWYAGKIAFTPEVFEQAATEILAGLDTIQGNGRKLLILDLDDTLWGGTVGDLGWESLTLGGHNALGEAFVDFQRALKALSRRGMLLAIVSKNDEAVAVEAISRHPEMVLRLDDLVAWRINWGDKAANIAELARELNLGLQSVVFIDDNPAERGRVGESLPEVLVPDWPANPLLYVEALARLCCFDQTAITDEDLIRAQSYRAEASRRNSRAGVRSVEEWLASLQLKVLPAPLGDDNIVRVVQLLNKTNQMNLATRRLTEGELRHWLAAGRRRFFAFSVADRYGDYGLTGLMSLDCQGDSAEIVDFVLSCRVFGRGVELTMLAFAVACAREAGCGKIRAAYRPTTKNAPTLQFLTKESGLERAAAREDGAILFGGSCQGPSLPAHVTLGPVLAGAG